MISRLPLVLDPTVSFLVRPKWLFRCEVVWEFWQDAKLGQTGRCLCVSGDADASLVSLTGLMKCVTGLSLGYADDFVLTLPYRARKPGDVGFSQSFDEPDSQTVRQTAGKLPVRSRNSHSSISITYLL